jgi:hypothetical protein
MDDLFHLCPKFPFGAGVTAEQGWGRDSGVAGQAELDMWEQAVELDMLARGEELELDKLEIPPHLIARGFNYSAVKVKARLT